MNTILLENIFPRFQKIFKKIREKKILYAKKNAIDLKAYEKVI